MENTIKKRLSGWSEYQFYSCTIFTPNNFEDLQSFLQNNKDKKIIARGHGCSNGDQSILKNGVVIDMSNINKIISYDNKKKTIEVEAGVKLTEVLMISLKDDLFLSSTPGGLDITVGGAVSNNIHGKDCFKNGYFENNVKKMKILTSEGKMIEVSKTQNKELYEGMFSSQGLLGIIYSIELELKQTKSSILEVETKVANNILEMESYFENMSNDSDYAVAWLDCAAKEESIMRGIFSEAKFITNLETEKNSNNLIQKKINKFLIKREKNIKKIFFKFFWRIIGKVFGSSFFKLFNFFIFNSVKMIGFNKKITILPEFLLMEEKYLPEYKYLFKEKGFLCIQPFFSGEKPFEKIKDVILLCQKYKILPIWCPIKKYKKPINETLTFGGDGYSIVIEFSPHEIGLEKTNYFLSDLENLIIAQKGKVYLAKDQIISNNSFKQMYPKYKKFIDLKKKYDKDDIFISEQFERLFK